MHNYFVSMAVIIIAKPFNTEAAAAAAAAAFKKLTCGPVAFVGLVGIIALVEVIGGAVPLPPKTNEIECIYLVTYKQKLCPVFSVWNNDDDMVYISVDWSSETIPPIR
ncbi:hypothetical protein DERP_005931 [Dermatophagoides pteronyssinus]|uniref:Uncharacterized protein n=1 Tax=Dermatophagoides pteronyssinus TaxID=6956 RepID=A0ABQ8JRV0_DERPT|nr:hypothetical protein DERP_005931 [Dermatophagoides pteronyssinus]